MCMSVTCERKAQSSCLKCVTSSLMFGGSSSVLCFCLKQKLLNTHTHAHTPHTHTHTHTHTQHTHAHAHAHAHAHVTHTHTHHTHTHTHTHMHTHNTHTHTHTHPAVHQRTSHGERTGQSMWWSRLVSSQHWRRLGATWRAAQRRSSFLLHQPMPRCL